MYGFHFWQHGETQWPGRTGGGFAALRRHPKDGGGSGDTAALQQEVEGLHEELSGVRQELSELAERLDFAERMLAKQREGERLGPPQG